VRCERYTLLSQRNILTSDLAAQARGAGGRAHPPLVVLPRGRRLGAPGERGARPHCRFVLPLIHFIPDSLAYSVPLFLQRQYDRTLGERGQRQPGPVPGRRLTQERAAAAARRRRARARPALPHQTLKHTISHSNSTIDTVCLALELLLLQLAGVEHVRGRRCLAARRLYPANPHRLNRQSSRLADMHVSSREARRKHVKASSVCIARPDSNPCGQGELFETAQCTIVLKQCVICYLLPADAAARYARCCSHGP
jgi:hypothetical protein